MHMVIEGNYGPVSPDPKTRGREMVIVSNSFYTHQQENYRGLPKHFPINVLHQENNFK